MPEQLFDFNVYMVRRCDQTILQEASLFSFFYPNGGVGLLRQVFDFDLLSDLKFFESRIGDQSVLRLSFCGRVPDIVLVGGRDAVRIRLDLLVDPGDSCFCLDAVLFGVQIFVSDKKADGNYTLSSDPRFYPMAPVNLLAHVTLTF